MFRRFSLSDQFVGLSVHQKVRPETEVSNIADGRKSRSLNTSPITLQKKKKDLDLIYANCKSSRIKQISVPELSNTLGGHFIGRSRRNSAIKRNYGELYRTGVSVLVVHYN